MNVSLLSSIKDEGPFLLEWIAHHKVVGFDHILIAYNDCTDGSDVLLEKLAEHGEIDTFHNRIEQGDRPQQSAYNKLFSSDFVQSANCIAVLDADEFLNIHFGDGKVHSLLSAIPDCDFLAMNWKCFGSGNHENWDDSPVTEKFTYSIPGVRVGNRGTKSITFNLQNFSGLKNHHPGNFTLTRPMTYSNGAGTVFKYTKKFQGKNMNELNYLPTDQVSHALVQVNHYATKTIDSFCLRAARGRGAVSPVDQYNGTNEQLHHNLEYFISRNDAATSEDTSISRYFLERRDEQARLLELDGIEEIVINIMKTYQKRIDFVQQKLGEDVFDMTEYTGLKF